MALGWSGFQLLAPFVLEMLYFQLLFPNPLKIFELLLFCCFLPVDRFTEFVRIGLVLAIHLVKDPLAFGRLKSLEVPIFHVVLLMLMGFLPGVVFQEQEPDQRQGVDYAYQVRLTQVMFVTDLFGCP